MPASPDAPPSTRVAHPEGRASPLSCDLPPEPPRHGTAAIESAGMVPLLLCLVLAPESTCEMKLRFEKGMVYEDVSSRRVKLRLVQPPVPPDTKQRMIRFDVGEECLFRRTVVGVGEDGLPSEEKVEVVKFQKEIHERPDGEPGKQDNPAQGKTFTWRRKGDRYLLYEGDRDVTAEHARLAERLMSYRAKRLPDKPVAVGSTWEVPATAFLEATGQQVPPGLEGTATFKLEELKDNIARVSFEMKSSFREQDREISGVQRGTWMFDVARGRELSLEAEGAMEFDRLERGDGSLSMTRTLTYR